MPYHIQLFTAKTLVNMIGLCIFKKAFGIPQHQNFWSVKVWKSLEKLQDEGRSSPVGSNITTQQVLLGCFHVMWYHSCCCYATKIFSHVWRPLVLATLPPFFPWSCFCPRFYAGTLCTDVRVRDVERIIANVCKVMWVVAYVIYQTIPPV